MKTKSDALWDEFHDILSYLRSKLDADGQTKVDRLDKIVDLLTECVACDTGVCPTHQTCDSCGEVLCDCSDTSSE